jgi:hypothetical protein
MWVHVPITFASPTALLAGLAVLCCAAAAALWRRPGWPIPTWALFATGAIAIALAAGSPQVYCESPVNVAVMIDVSPSTRGATFQDPAQRSQRIAQLLGGTPYRLFSFSGEGSTRAVSADRLPMEEPAAQTTFAPPLECDAILLFSDARFRAPLPAILQPTYPSSTRRWST